MKELHLSPKDDLQKIFDGITGPTTIYLAAGVYRQKLEIAKDDVTLIGEDRETTVLTYDDYARKIHADGKEFVTFRTYSLCVSGERCRLENLTVENSNSDPREVGQCVALSVNCRDFSAKNIDLKSTQDTLFCYPFPDDLVVRYMGLTDDDNFYEGFLPARQLFLEGTSLHLFENCRIYGTVDFIFGGAEAYFKNCEIISTYDSRGKGYIAAPCHHLVQKGGFYFIDCDIKAEGEGIEGIYLARPWRDFGKCTFINCRLGKHVNPVLFDKWNDTRRDKTARFEYYGLKGDVTPAPVTWAKELTPAEVKEIINTCNAKFKDKKRKN